MNESEHPIDEANRDLRERGATLVEYALLIAFMAIACFVAVQFLGSKTSGGFSNAGSSIFVSGS